MAELISKKISTWGFFRMLLADIIFSVVFRVSISGLFGILRVSGSASLLLRLQK